jgi:ubiquinone/menaquinone biosynthesis C-methylase UbiE
MNRPAGPTRRLFDAWSHVYDIPAVQRAIYKPVQDAVVDALPRDARRVLDVGCGTGQLAVRLAEERHDARVTGCDFSFGMLEQAASRTHEVDWVQGDALHLPFADAVFDAVTSTEAFHWFPNQVAALREMRRVLLPGGTALVAVATPSLAVVRRVGLAVSRAAGQPSRWLSRAQLRHHMEAAGLRLVAQRRIPRLPGGVLLPPVLTVAERPGTPAR